ncbi:MAG: CoA transferase [Chloroflexi bacterium]|nr:CoA transferase [Chloroflexota bacterium]
MTGPLEGLRVIDLTQGYIGYCGMIFADLGATVTKVEPPEGDYLRRHGPPFVGDVAAAFLGVNRTKQSVLLDWRNHPAARAALDRLIDQADVLISDLYPDEATATGLTWAALRPRLPRLVLVPITPWGNTGPLANQRASELDIQAMSGQWRYVGDLNQAPIRHGLPLGSTTAALFAFQGAMAALLERDTSGRGQEVEVSQVGSQITMQTIQFISESEPDEWIGHCLAAFRPQARGYATADLGILWGFMDNEQALETFCEWLGLPEILRDSGPRTFQWQADHKAEFEAAFRTHTAEDLVAKVRELGGNAVPYNTFSMVAADPQAQALGLISAFDYPGAGSVGTIGVPWEFSDTPAAHGRPPLLGEHTREALAAAGLSPQEIEGSVAV